MVVLAASRSRPVMYSRPCCGFSTLARNGTCCRRATRTTKLCTDAFSLGARRDSAPRSRMLRTCFVKKARSMKRNASSTPRLPWPRAAGREIGPTRRGKGMKIMAIVDRHGLPLSVSTHAANHHEVRLCSCFDFYMIEAKPANLIGDRAYDSDKLDAEMRAQGTEMISPHRSKQAAHARSPTAVVRAPLDRRALLCLDTMATPAPGSLGIPPSNFLGFVQLACPLSSSNNFEIGSSLLRGGAWGGGPQRDC